MHRLSSLSSCHPVICHPVNFTECQAMLYAMIMAGGGGTRFWPRSRKRRPKQFLTLTGERSLLQMALDRLEVMAPPERTWVITGAAYVEETRAQLPQLTAERIVGEPVGRDT